MRYRFSAATASTASIPWRNWCAMPRSIRSTKAPPRSSVWSSRETCTRWPRAIN